jgi:hypothetical protein
MKRLLFKRGFSDKLYFYNFRAVWVFTGACYLLNALSGVLGVSELAVITYGIPAAFAELGLHTGFIVWKAKVENCRKNKDYSKLEELEEMEL